MSSGIKKKRFALETAAGGQENAGLPHHHTCFSVLSLHSPDPNNSGGGGGVVCQQGLLAASQATCLSKLGSKAISKHPFSALDSAYFKANHFVDGKARGKQCFGALLVCAPPPPPIEQKQNKLHKRRNHAHMHTFLSLTAFYFILFLKTEAAPNPGPTPETATLRNGKTVYGTEPRPLCMLGN